MERPQRNIIQKILSISVEPAAFIVFFYLIINRIIFGGGWLQISVSTFEKVFMEIIMWILDGILFLWIASQKKNYQDYLTFWKKNWILPAFILFAASSIIWSEFPAVTIYKAIVLIACSAITTYLGMTFSLPDILKNLSIYFAVLIFLSFSLALLYPPAGTHLGWPYYGAWRGLFFHKNYLGTMMAFSTSVSFISFFIEKKVITRIAHAMIYLLATGLIILSRSATGIIIFFVLNAGLTLILVWLKLRDHLNMKHYIIFGIISGIVITLALINLDFLFGLLNKETSLTGRLPMWSFLVNYGMTHHPLIGSGLGALWAIDEFRQLTVATVGWGFASLSSDNGFVDIFLHLGLLGELLLISCFLFCSIRVVMFSIKEKTLVSFFPIIAVVFLILVNFSVSYFLEFESFGWFLLVFALFSTTQNPTLELKTVN